MSLFKKNDEKKQAEVLPFFKDSPQLLKLNESEFGVIFSWYMIAKKNNQNSEIDDEVFMKLTRQLKRK